MLSVIIPAYNEQETIQITSSVLEELLSSSHIEYELIFVDDGSADRTWMFIQKAAAESTSVRGVHFSRNFGKEAAIMAGLASAQGDCCAVIDCDLQHPPEKLIDMYHLWEQGYEVIEGIKSDRGKESRLHRFAAHKFYSLISASSGFEMENTSDYKMLDRKVVNVLLQMREQNSFFRAMSSWVGFRTATVTYEVQERTAGESKWSSKALIRYAIQNITSFTTLPMQLVSFLGFIMLVIGIIFSCISLVQYFMGAAVEGFTTVIILQLFSSSIIMISIGIIGYYIARIFEEVKRRPMYIISETCGNAAESSRGKR